MSRRSFRGGAAWRWGRKLMFVLVAVLALGVFLLVVEHVRGRVMLSRYLRSLKAQGVKLTAEEFMDPPVTTTNGAPEVLEAANTLKPGAVLPANYPPRMRLTPSGHAIVCFREEQWVEDKVTNHWESLAADLETNQAALKRIRDGLASPALVCDFDPSLGPRAEFKHLPVAKRLTVWFGSSTQLGLHSGNTRAALPDLLAELDLPRMLARDGIVISELVRAAIAGVARVDTWEALQDEGWTDEALAKIQGAWAQHEFADAMVRAIEGEMVFARSSYRHMRASNQETVDDFFALDNFAGTGEKAAWEQWLGTLPGGSASAEFLKTQVYTRVWRFAWLPQDELHYLEFMGQLMKLGRDASQEKSFQKLQPRLDDLIQRFQNRGFYNELRYRSEMSVRAMSRVLMRPMRAETERSLVLTAIALKRYANRHGAAPANLDALVSEFLPSVPVDFMDGGLIKYRREADGGFVLYSVGEDGKDDNGDRTLRPHETGTTLWGRKDVVWPSPATPEEIEAYRVPKRK